MSCSRPIDVLGRVLGPLVRLPDLDHPPDQPGCFGADVAADERISAEELRLIVERAASRGSSRPRRSR